MKSFDVPFLVPDPAGARPAPAPRPADPDPAAVFIVSMELPYYPPGHELGQDPLLLPQGTLVHRVRRNPQKGGWDYTLKARGYAEPAPAVPGHEAWTYYGWALVPDTPENRALLEAAWAIQVRQAALDREAGQAWARVPRLEPDKSTKEALPDGI